jgi:putative nucleotidyltransferase with HDIG domain
MDAPTVSQHTEPISIAERRNHAAPTASVDATRLHHLFRTCLRDGRVHPLLRVMQLYRPRMPGYETTPMPALCATAPTPRPLAEEQVRRHVAELPPLPQAALRALQTLRREDASLEEVATDLSCDASLTARVLRLANSPFYGVPGRVSSGRDAAQMLGRRTLESVLALAAVAGQFSGQRSEAFDASAFWRHAVASAIAAGALARAAGFDEDQAFVAGLLHDIGLLAMSVYFPDDLDALLLYARAADVELCTVERRHALTAHAEVGAWIAAHWRFPVAVERAIAAHHAPPAGAGAIEGIAVCVHVGNAIAHALDVANLQHELVPMIEPAAWQRVALEDEAFCRLFDETERGVQALCAALAL